MQKSSASLSIDYEHMIQMIFNLILRITRIDDDVVHKYGALGSTLGRKLGHRTLVSNFVDRIPCVFHQFSWLQRPVSLEVKGDDTSVVGLVTKCLYIIGVTLVSLLELQ